MRWFATCSCRRSAPPANIARYKRRRVGATVDYLIRGKLYEFSEVDQPGIQTRISLQLEVVAGKTGLVVWSRNYNRDEPVHGKTMNDVVASLNRNLQQVIADSTSAIDSFLSSQIRR